MWHSQGVTGSSPALEEITDDKYKCFFLFCFFERFYYTFYLTIYFRKSVTWYIFDFFLSKWKCTWINLQKTSHLHQNKYIIWCRSFLVLLWLVGKLAHGRSVTMVKPVLQTVLRQGLRNSEMGPRQEEIVTSLPLSDSKVPIYPYVLHLNGPHSCTNTLVPFGSILSSFCHPFHTSHPSSSFCLPLSPPIPSPLSLYLTANSRHMSK